MIDKEKNILSMSELDPHCRAFLGGEISSALAL